MPQRKPGRTLFLALACLLSACNQSDPPPPIEVCLLDGFGGGDCIEPDGSKLFRPPSQMKNYWATNEHDQALFAAWCYGTDAPTVRAGMEEVKSQALK